VETVAFTHGVQDVLQGNFVPPVGDADAHALFRFQNVFMYSVFEAKIKTNKGMSIVRSHKNDRNAQDVWKELVAHQSTLTTGNWNHQHLLTFLQTFKLDSASWRGSHTGFLAHYKDKLREYECLTPVADHHSDDMKRNMLEQALMKIPELSKVRNKIEFARAQWLPLPTFDAYVDLIEVAASLLDARAESSRPPRRNTTIISTPAVAVNSHLLDFPEDGTQQNAYSVNRHALYDNFEGEHNIDTIVSELAMYQCIQTDTEQERSAFWVAQAYAPKDSLLHATNQVSLDCATWHNLPKEDKAIWDTLSPTGKSAIINWTCQHGLEVAETCKTVNSKYTRNAHSTNITSPTPTPITNMQKVNVTDIKSVPTAGKFSDTLESNSQIQFASAQENSIDSNYPSENFLVNLAKSHLPPSGWYSLYPVTTYGQEYCQRSTQDSTWLNQEPLCWIP
jgi:hypothetical protein